MVQAKIRQHFQGSNRMLVFIRKLGAHNRLPNWSSEIQTHDLIEGQSQ